MRAVRLSPSPAGARIPSRHIRGLPVLVQKVSRRVWGLRLRRTGPGLALSLLPMWPSAVDGVGVLIAVFRSSIPSPPLPLFTLHRTPRDTPRKTRGRADRYSFLVGLSILCFLPVYPGARIPTFPQPRRRRSALRPGFYRETPIMIWTKFGSRSIRGCALPGSARGHGLYS